MTESKTDRATARESSRASRASSPVPFVLKLIRLGFSTVGRLVPDLAGRIAYRLWITPPRFPVPQPERDSLAQCEQLMLDINGRQIATYTWGADNDGPGILLVHGWSGRGTQLATFVEPLLQRGFRVVSFDAPAHGRSSGRQTNLYQIVDTILELEKQLGDFTAAITHSFGGPCLAAAMKRGFRTGCVVNISPPSTVLGLVEKFSDALTLPDTIEGALTGTIEKQFGEQVWQEASMESNVRDIDARAMVIHDIDDIDVPWHEGQAVARAWPRARFIKTAGLGHRRILKDTGTINSAVDFIAECTHPDSAGRASADQATETAA